MALDRLKGILWRLLGPTDRQVEAAAAAQMDYPDRVNSTWDSPITDREYRIEAMRAAMEAARKVV